MRFFPAKFAGGRWYPWRQKLVEWLSLILLVALVVGPLSFLGWLVFFTNTFRIQAVTVVDAHDHTQQEIISQTKEVVGQNIMFIQTIVIQQRLLNNIPQLRDVRIVRKLPGTLKIIAQEKTPALLLISSGKYHFVDSGGIVYEPARLETLPGTVLPIIKNSDETAKTTLGTRAVEPTFVQFVLQAEASLPAVVGAQVAGIRIPSLSAREVHFQFDNNWVVRLDSTRSLDAQLRILKNLLDYSIDPQKKSQIEYIDLRIPKRVYYKYR